MGLFGSSSQKKLEKARRFQARGDHYSALQIYEQMVFTFGASPGEADEAREGSRACRRAMIALLLEEAEALRRARDLEEARDRCQTAAELAEDDMDLDAVIEETLQRINAPRWPLALRRTLQDAVEGDSPSGPDENAPAFPGPSERPSRGRFPYRDPENFGDDPVAQFEMALVDVDSSTAEYFRSLGPDFRSGYMALSQREGRRALEYFERLDWSAIRDPRALLERAQALFLAERGEEALAELDALASPTLARAEEERRLYLRVGALRALGRLEEAIAEARQLAGPGEDEETEALLAWTLLEAGHAEAAYWRLSPKLSEGDASEEILIPAARAARAAGMTAEEARLLRLLIQERIEWSPHPKEMEFPVDAGRRLLALYLEGVGDEAEIRTLLLLLVPHDPKRAESYRSLLDKLEQTD